ncbi:hypothetical protein ACJX0J_033549, partial [Zea mays]
WALDEEVEVKAMTQDIYNSYKLLSNESIHVGAYVSLIEIFLTFSVTFLTFLGKNLQILYLGSSCSKILFSNYFIHEIIKIQKQ